MKRLILPVLVFLFTAGFFSAQNYIQYSYTDSEIEQLSAIEARGHVSEKDAVITSTSTIDWSKNTFKSEVVLDLRKAKIPMPSGKSTSISKIQMELPVLVKDPLLSVHVDNARTLGDLVLDGTLTLEELTRIIDSSRQTPAYFANGTSNLLTEHSIYLRQIGALLVKHHVPYSQKQPVESVASMAYTGIIIDARGSLPVHGEFIESEVSPCLFPRVWNDRMELVYERNMVDPETAKNNGVAYYTSSIFPDEYEDRVGKNPLWITARKVYGVNRTDPVLSYDDYLKIVSVKENLNLFKQAKVVILLDQKQLVHGVTAPEKNKNYYMAFHRMQRYFFENKVPDSVVIDSSTGTRIIMNNLHFIADSPKLLPEEKERIEQIAESIKKFTASGEFTILVEGHTADVKKPDGQLLLSNQRAQEIISELVAFGVDKNLFTFKGYGGTKPVADNSTDEGRAQN
ncbi:MAG: OmpA family protein, partial [Treponema sp.]|nr:OmpA family protein [Treponema sp.]